VFVVEDHQARVTCIKFSKDYQFLFTCDARGVIHHYQRNCHKGDEVVMSFESNPNQTSPEERKQKDSSSHDTNAQGASRHRDSNKNAFPFTMMYRIQDQMDEIVDIDTNHVLDMYVTLSKDGTIALRCMRTSQLWQHFLLMNVNKVEPQNKDVEIVTGFSKIFG